MQYKMLKRRTVLDHVFTFSVPLLVGIAVSTMTIDLRQKDCTVCRLDNNHVFAQVFNKFTSLRLILCLSVSDCQSRQHPLVKTVDSTISPMASRRRVSRAA